MATPFTLVTGSESITSTEHSLPNDSTTLTPQTTACKLAGYIDARNMVAADQYRIRVLEKVAGGTQAVVWEAFITGVQVELYPLPERWVNEGWDVTMKLITGAASTVTWSLKQDVGDRNALTIAAAALSSIWAVTSEAGETVGDVLRLLAARLFGNATVRDGDGAYVFRDKADTKDRIAGSRSGTARTVSTRDGT